MSREATREALPQRRRAETFELDWGGLNLPHTITVGYYNDGRVGEVFIDAGKSGEVVEAIARDGAILLSLAIQHGADIEAIARAITRDSQSKPTSIIGAVIDELVVKSTNDTPTS